MPVEMYHQICFYRLGNNQEVSIARHKEATLGSLIFHDPEGHCWVEIARSEAELKLSKWGFFGPHSGERMSNGWTRCDIPPGYNSVLTHIIQTQRFNAQEIYGGQIYLYINCYGSHWLSQANHIFKRLGITSHHGRDNRRRDGIRGRRAESRSCT
jgi:hypothetical protein